MDVTLVAFLLSAVLSGIAVYTIGIINRNRKRPRESDDSPRGPVTIGT